MTFWSGFDSERVVNLVTNVTLIAICEEASHMKMICFFRCLALHNGCHTKNLERDTKHYYQQYREAGLAKKKFHGVQFSELDELKKLYEVNIQVYSLAPTQSHGSTEEKEETPDITATLLQCHHHFSSTL